MEHQHKRNARLFFPAILMLVAMLLSTLSACGGTDGKDGADGKSAYELAVQNGYSGTVDEWLASLAGDDGQSAYALAVEKGYVGTEEEWLISLIGEAGKDARGEKGDTGANGKSAYELAVESGFEGDMALWLASLMGPKGETGPQGEAGAAGKSAYEIAVSYGYDGSEEDWLASLKGETGAKGEKGDKGDKGNRGDKGDTGETGADGKSAYDIAVELGYDGSKEDWLADMKGETGEKGEKGDKGDTGATGATGQTGATGAAGQDAYDLAVDQGFEGTEEAWLASLKGEKGDTGATGNDGRTLEFRAEGNWVQWKYTDEDDATWRNLYEVNSTPAPEGLVRVRYSVGGGNFEAGVPYTVDVTAGTYIYLPTPAYDGYAFDGWYLDGEEYPVTSPYRVHESVVLTAKWVPGAKITGTKIYTFSDLKKINDNLGGTYVLMNDIDCNGLAITIGTSSDNAFRGVFDGQGNTISNFKASNGTLHGLFGCNNGTIRNLNVKSPYLHVDNVSTSSNIYVGGIAGLNYGTIERCSVYEGDVYINATNNRYAGLITGGNRGTILDCWASGLAKVTQPEYTDNEALAGGITAFNFGVIENSYANADVYAYGYHANYPYRGNYGRSGLISGYNASTGKIKNCLAFGSILYGNLSKADIARTEEGGIITNCYRDENASLNSPTHTYATPMGKDQMSAYDFYAYVLEWDPDVWSFTNVNIDNGVYPLLNQK